MILVSCAFGSMDLAFRFASRVSKTNKEEIILCMPHFQGWKFSDFSLISDFFTLTIMKIIFEISS